SNWCIGILVVCCIPFWWVYSQWLRRFGNCVRRFRTLESTRIVLHHALELKKGWQWAALLNRWEAELNDLARQFGFPLPRRLVVYLFASRTEVGLVRRRAVSGFALTWANAIVLADDCNDLEPFRHEVAHLFSFRWNAFAPPILSEGLSTWLQGTWGGRPIDVLALALHRERPPSLSALLNPRFFYSDSEIS